MLKYNYQKINNSTIQKGVCIIVEIIRGKKYDTDTARCLGSTSYGNPGDFHYTSEELYVKKTGEFFLYGEGGPLSPYVHQKGTNDYTTGGSAIIPLSLDRAKDWAKKNLSAETYIEIFGDVEE